MSLHDPIRIDVSNESVQLSSIKSIENDQPAQMTLSQVKDTKSGKKSGEKQKEETFATPASLEHQCVVVPSKLRLVTLAAFLLAKCKVCFFLNLYISEHIQE